MCAFILLDRIQMFFYSQPFEKSFWWGEQDVREGPFLHFCPGSLLVRFSEKFTLKFHAPSSTPLQIYTQSTFVSQRLRWGHNTEKVCQAIQVDSCAKIPQLRLQMGRTGKNSQLLLVENSTGTLHWVPMPSAHIVPSGCTTAYMSKRTHSVVCEQHVASGCLSSDHQWFPVHLLCKYVPVY